MPVYTIDNPSDPYTIEGSFAACAVGVLVIGDGKMGLSGDLEPDEESPLLLGAMLLGQEAFERILAAWLVKTLGTPEIDVWIDEHCEELGLACESVVVGRVKERELFTATMADLPGADARQRFAARWDDARRSSMNEIGLAFRRYGRRLRQRAGRRACKNGPHDEGSCCGVCMIPDLEEEGG